MKPTDFVDIFKDIVGNYGLSPIIAEMIKFIFSNPFETLVIVDKQGKIQYLDPSSEKVFGLSQGGAKEQNINEVLPQSRLKDVILSGKPHIGTISNIRGKKRIVSMVPLVRNGEVVGAFGKVLLHSLEELERVRKEANDLKRRVIYAEKKIANNYTTSYAFADILGESKEIKEAIGLAKKMAKADVDIIIHGESGTGKELFAHAIHGDSRRLYKPFVKVNCPAIPVEIAESELFGYERGAFTGAKHDGKLGKFEFAQGGTLFLDEIGSLPISIQAKLLRVIQEREIERVGGDKLIPLNFRVTATTNADLYALSEQGVFRSDLYFRLSKAILYLPPLRNRVEDIPIYINRFLNIMRIKNEMNVEGISKEFLEAMIRYNWPGNVRELFNVLEQSIFQMGSSKELHFEHLPKHTRQSMFKPSCSLEIEGSLKDIREQAEKEALVQILTKFKGNKRKSAQQLKISRSVLYLKLAKYGLVDNNRSE